MMMMIQFEAFAAVLIFVVLVLLVRGPWRTVCTDFARQVMFENRDAIFDLAREGRISFDAPEYCHARLLIERNIRFAHELSISRLVFFFTLVDQDSAVPDLEEVFSSIGDEHVRNSIRRHVWISQRALVIMTIAKSPLLIVLGSIFLGLSVISKTMLRIRRDVTRDVAQVIQAEANNESSGFNSKKAA